MDPRPGFMLFGSFIIPGPVEPPAPPQPHQPNPSSSHDSLAKPNNDNHPIPQHPAVMEDDPSLVENTKKAKRLVVKLNGELLFPPDFVAKPNSVKEDDPSLVETKKKPVIKRLVCKLNSKRLYPERGLLSPHLRHLLVSMGVAEDHSPIHFFSRALFPSDVQKGLTRLTIPKTQLLRPFLTDQEEALLQERDANKNLKRLEVDVVDPSLEVRTLRLSRWNYKKSAAEPDGRPRRSTRSWSYALNGGWMDLVNSNGLAAGDTVQVWSFRKNDASLGFIIFKEDRGPAPAPATANDYADRNPVVLVEQGSSSSGDHTDKDRDNGGAPTWGKKRKRGSSSSLSTMTTA